MKISMARRMRSRSLLLLPLLAASLALPAGPARADGTPVRTIETHVLPIGQYTLGTITKQGAAALRTVRTRAAEDDGAQVALETVGPAARFAKKSSIASAAAQPPSRPAAGQLAAAAVTYPAPTRTMTAAECRTALGSSNKFFLKSRFAVCSGASFLQTWLQNGRPVGESMFNVMAVGTIGENTRQIQFTYHVTDRVSTGNTGVTGMQITLEGKIAQSWPSTVKYTPSGTALPVTKTWAQFAAASSVQTSVTAAKGVGSNGSTETIFAVYQPSVKIKAPAPWTLGGSTGGNLFMLAPRWDKANYLANSANGGAATFSYLGTLYYSKAEGAPERAVALHIEKAFKTPGQTQPPSSTKKIPGQTADEPLTRLYTDTARRDRNRAVAVSNCRKYFGPDYATGGKECDEFPFASTYQGAAGSEYDPYQLPNNFSVQALDGTQNGNAGNLLGQFVSKYRILDGPDDGYLVQITG
ncbi:hypothetical protein ACH5AJ_15165 [Streptomyces rochei]|uniref:Deoxyribonuclease NucA/NucB domain-containing protein n=1 Tax=Streptomyces plicatus TaxID=1922 RepID=A0ABW1Y432_STRPL|nr:MULTISPECIES: hypothetical protein [Streptomyces]GGZ81629.1 hypothetical protein GCM10010301_63460 [Streptomyces plicatus]GHC36264.1 hypothetical protein GCM10010308_63330 [Streptomyces vinaceusdrappus]